MEPDPSLMTQQWIFVTSLVFSASVSTSNVIVDADFKVSAVAEVEEVLKLVVGELVAGVIGLEEGL